MIRKATISDADFYANILSSAWKKAYKDIVPKKEFYILSERKHKKQQFFKLFEDKENNIYFKIYNDEPVGMINFSKHKIVNNAMYIMQLYIHPDFQGKKIGTELLNFAEEFSKEIGSKKVLLNTLEKNFVARKFYEKHGYVFYDTEISPVFSEEIVRALYKKELSL